MSVTSPSDPPDWTRCGECGGRADLIMAIRGGSLTVANCLPCWLAFERRLPELAGEWTPVADAATADALWRVGRVQES